MIVLISDIYIDTKSISFVISVNWQQLFAQNMVFQCCVMLIAIASKENLSGRSGETLPTFFLSLYIFQGASSYQLYTSGIIYQYIIPSIMSNLYAKCRTTTSFSDAHIYQGKKEKILLLEVLLLLLLLSYNIPPSIFL